MLFWIKQLVKWTILPPTGPLLLTFVGLALIGRHQRQGRFLAVAGVVMLTLLSLPAVGGFLVRCLDRSEVLDVSKAGDAQAIVILGGGTRHAPEYGGATVDAVTLERVRYGATLARETGLPLLVSGGAIASAPPEALLMRNVLVNEFRVPVRWLETRSRNTHENAVKSAAILKANHVRRVILVGHSFDFPRASREFEAAGINVTRAPLNLPMAGSYTFDDFWPSAKGLQYSYYACYEILANAAYSLTHIGVSSNRRDASNVRENSAAG